MTEGTPAALATWGDVQSRWRSLTTGEQTLATTRIGDASALLRTLIPDIDDRLANDATGNLAAVVTSKVADVVIRFLQNPNGAKQLQETIGPRGYGMTFDGRPSGIFFTDEELASLRPTAGIVTTSTAIGTLYVGARPGWAPTSPRRRSWL